MAFSDASAAAAAAAAASTSSPDDESWNFCLVTTMTTFLFQIKDDTDEIVVDSNLDILRPYIDYRALGTTATEIQEYKTNIKLLLVGPYEQELDPLKEETLNQINANKSIFSVGYQDEVRPYFAISDCLVFPSYREGFPNVVMQAGAMGLPSIVSDINGCNEIIEDTKNGYIIPVRDKEAVKETLLRILENKEAYSKIQQNARAMIVSRFDLLP